MILLYVVIINSIL